MEAVVAPIDHQRVGEALTDPGIRWMRTPDANFVAHFADKDTKADEVLTITYQLEGCDNTLAVRSILGGLHAPDAWPRVIGLLNAWNVAFRWPSAALWTTDTQGRVIAETQVFLAAGVHDQLLSSLLDTATRCTVQLAEWLSGRLVACAEATTPDICAADLEEWLRRGV